MNSEQHAISHVSAWGEALLAAALFAVDPPGTAGIVLRCRAGPLRDVWLQSLRLLLPASAPLRRVPLNITDSRLLGGLDLASTLRAGKPIVDHGILVEANGGVALLSMVERMTAAAAARLANVIDTGVVVLERDGLALRNSVSISFVALDEGLEENERCPEALVDRLAFLVDLSGVEVGDNDARAYTPQDIVAARNLLQRVNHSEAILRALCESAMTLGIGSLRVSLLALRAACASAALAGRGEVLGTDAAMAARLVLAPRATMCPTKDQAGAAPKTSAPQTQSKASPNDATRNFDQEAEQILALDERLEEVVLNAAVAAIPKGLLAQLELSPGAGPRPNAAGKSGALKTSGKRGRATGVRLGRLDGAARLNLLETLRAAVPWQKLRRNHKSASDEETPKRILVRPEDFRITRYRQRAETVTIFAVDASGSTAINRLAEAKGAVELLLADCYVRRDHVALLAFRGLVSVLLLPPTRSLVRAKRSLAGLAGGGGTPLACGIDGSVRLAEEIRRKGQTPIIVLLTDGAANIARDGKPGRAKAEQDALAAARLARAAGLTALLVDTSPRPQPFAQRLSVEMSARYVPLPYAQAAELTRAVRMSTAT
jgi:magnesium chelatase subunit D